MSYGHVERARKLRPIIERASPSLDDRAASEGVELFPVLKQDGSLVKAGTRIRWNGVLKRAAVDIWDTEQNNPDNAPAMWEDIAYKEGYRIIPEIITSTLAFGLGEVGWRKEAKYKSLVAANTYTPDEYPAGWEMVE
jgi:hypothetical protein